MLNADTAWTANAMLTADTCDSGMIKTSIRVDWSVVRSLLM